MVHQPRTVLWLIDSLSLGGAERLAVDFLLNADPQRVRVHLVALRAAAADADALERELRQHGAEFHCIHQRNLRDREGFERLCRLVARLRPELIHTHLRYATIWGARVGKRLGIPVVSTLHVLPAPRHQWREWVLSPLENWTLNHSIDRVITVSHAQQKLWRELGLHGRNVCVIPNGVAPIAPPEPAARAALRAQWNIGENTFVFLTVAVVRRPKGWPFLLQAIPKILEAHPNSKFVWVGGGADAEALRAAVHEAGLENHVLLAGIRADIPSWLGIADVFLFPSLQEALPTAVIEAMSAGVPVVASDLPAVREVLGDEAELARPADPDALAHAACRMAASQFLRKQTTLRQRERFAQHFASNAWRERLTETYEEVISAQAEKRSEPAGQLRVAQRGQKILAVEFLSRGGLFHYSLQLCRALDAQGARVQLLTGRNPELPNFVGARPAPEWLRPVLWTWNPRRHTPPWLRPLERLSHGIQYPVAWLQVLWAAMKSRPDVLLFSDLEHRCDPWFIGWLRRRGFYLADIWHNVQSFERHAREGVVKDEPWRDQLAREFQTVFVHGEALARQLRQRTGVEPVVIPHGSQELALQAAGPDPNLAFRFNLEPGRAVALLFGTITKYKGVDTLLDALARVPERSRPITIIAGFPTDDVDPAALAAHARALGLERWVRWHLRYVPLPEVAWYFSAADFVVLPYRAASQSGVAHLALSAGKPLIVTSVGSLAEVVQNGVNGFVVPPEDADRLAATLAQMSIDDKKRSAMGESALRTAHAGHNWTDIALRVLEALGESRKGGLVCAASVDTSAAG